MALAFLTTVRLRWLAPAGAAAALSVLVALPMLAASQLVMPARPRSFMSLKSAEPFSALPPTLRAAASAVLGRDRSRYRLSTVSNGFEGYNPSQRLQLRSAPLGIVLTSDSGAKVRLKLAAAAVGDSPLHLRSAIARVEGNRAVYDAGVVQESFVNGPLGVEQRFSVRQRRLRSGSHVDLMLEISAGMRAAVSPNGTSAVLISRDGPVFRYSGIAANDARGRQLGARMLARNGRLVLEVQTRGSHFPISIDPLLRPYATLTGPSGQTSAFGSGVALSSDGNTAAIGGESDAGGVGAVWIFRRSGATWAQQGPKLTPQAASPATVSQGIRHFGAAVAISGNGDTIIVGDRLSPVMAAWVFVRVDGAWHQQGVPLAALGRKLESSGVEAVALSGDGRTAAFDGNVSNGSFTWVYAWSRGRWRQQARPLHAQSASLSLSANGKVLLVGTVSYIRSHSRWRAGGVLSPGPGTEGFSRCALSADGVTAVVTNSAHGYALIYRRSRTRWVRVARLRSPHPEPQVSFAEGVALSGDGNVVLLGASPRTESAGTKAAGYVFTRAGGDVWTSAAVLTMSRPWLAALSSDGSTILGPPDLHNVGEREEQRGPGQVFARAGGGWGEQATLAPTDATGVDSESFGGHFALSSDGSTALVSEGPGVAWVFSRNGESWTRQARLQVEGAAGRGGLVALSADGSTAVLAGPSAPGPVAAWVFSRTAGAWSSPATPLTASGEGPRPPGSTEEQESFASSLAISANGDVILVGAEWDSGDTGAAWLFTRSGSGWMQQGPKLTVNSPSPKERFGDSVALSASGATALIGGVGHAEHPPEGSAPEGAAYVFTRSEAGWTQTAKLIDGTHSPFEVHRELGHTVALSADGNTALLGAEDEAVAFTRTASGWQQHHPGLTPSPREHNAILGASNRFVAVVALSGDGSRALIGGPVVQGCGRYLNEPCTEKAVVWAFSRVGEAWVRQPLPLVRGLPFGAYVALSGDGEAALIQGVTPDSEPGGAVFVSQLTPPPQAGVVAEPTWIDYEGTIELQLWSPTSASFTATARIAPGRAGSSVRGLPCARVRPAPHAPATRHCSVSAVYGVGAAKGVENVGLVIVPRPAVRRYLARHKRLKLLITFQSKTAGSAPSRQTIAVVVPFRKPPRPEF